MVKTKQITHSEIPGSSSGQSEIIIKNNNDKMTSSTGKALPGACLNRIYDIYYYMNM